MRRIIDNVSFKSLSLVLLLGMGVFLCVKIQEVNQRVASMVKKERGFQVDNIECTFDYRKDWEVATPEALVTFTNVITQQPFQWLAKGAQAYAFASQDGEYVVKFFQQHRLRDKPFKEYALKYVFSQSFRDKVALKKIQKEEIFSSSKLAFEEIAEETGIVYVHLNRSVGLLRGIRIVDQRGTVTKVRPDLVSFIIQKRAQYVIPTLTALMDQKNIAGAEARIDQMLDLLLSLARKKITDSDYALIRNNNIGFTRDRAIYIDTGHLAKDPKVNVLERMCYEFDVRLYPLYEWMQLKYPELASYYKKRREEILTTLREESDVSVSKA